MTMTIKEFLDSNQAVNRAVTIQKLSKIYHMDINKARDVYKRWKELYMKDYTPGWKLDKKEKVDKRRLWSNDELIKIGDMRKQGYKAKQIASIFGTTVDAIYQQYPKVRSLEKIDVV